MFQKQKTGHSRAPASRMRLHKLCYLQIVICWQGLCHDTLLTYLLHLLQSCSLFPLQPAHCLLLLLTCQHQQQCILDGLYRLFAFLLWWSKISPTDSLIFHVWPYELIQNVFPFAAAGSCIVIFLLCVSSGRMPFTSDLGKWNVVIEEKVQIGSGCKWSLVSGRRFPFRR